MARKLLVTAILLVVVLIAAKFLDEAWQKHSTPYISKTRSEITFKQKQAREPLLAAAVSQYESGKLIGSDAAQHADLIKQPEEHIQYADRDKYWFYAITNFGQHPEGPPRFVMEVKNGRIVDAELSYPDF